MVKFIPFIISTIAGLSTMVGCLFIYLKPKNTQSFIGASLAFSATIMLLLSITELIPEGFFYLELRYNLLVACLTLVLMLFVGKGISKLINKKIAKHKTLNSNLYKVGVLSMLALLLHNLPEGILTYLSSVVDIKLGIKMSVAIMMHNIPEGIAIAVPIYYATGSKLKAVKGTFISGLAEPLGALLAGLILSRFINGLMLSLILLFTAGLMLSVANNDIFGEAKHYPRKSVMLGVGLAFILFTLNLLIFH